AEDGIRVRNVTGVQTCALPISAYTGILKALLDLLPQDVFKSKVVLPIMLGGSYKHLLAIEYTLKPVISILKGNSLNGVYIVDNKVDKKLENPILDEQIYD